MARRQGGWFCNMMIFILFVIWIFVSGLRKSRKFFSWLIYESALFRNLTSFYHASSFSLFYLDSLSIVSKCFWSIFGNLASLFPISKDLPLVVEAMRTSNLRCLHPSPEFKDFGIEDAFISSPYNVTLLSVLLSDRPTHQFELFYFGSLLVLPNLHQLSSLSPFFSIHSQLYITSSSVFFWESINAKGISINASVWSLLVFFFEIRLLLTLWESFGAWRVLSVI